MPSPISRWMAGRRCSSEGIRGAAGEPADRARGDAHENHAGLPRRVHSRTDSVQPPQGQEVRHAAAGHPHDILSQQMLLDVGDVRLGDSARWLTRHPARPKAAYIASSVSPASPKAVPTRHTRGLSPACASEAASPYAGPSRQSIAPVPGKPESDTGSDDRRPARGHWRIMTARPAGPPAVPGCAYLPRAVLRYPGRAIATARPRSNPAGSRTS